MPDTFPIPVTTGPRLPAARHGRRQPRVSPPAAPIRAAVAALLAAVAVAFTLAGPSPALGRGCGGVPGLDSGMAAHRRGDVEAAASLWRQCAAAGNPEAQYNLAVLIEGGVLDDGPGAAAEWYRRAADRGHLRAQVRLAALLLRGDAIPRDLVEAYKWYTLAAWGYLPQRQRYKANLALHGRDTAAARMTPEQIAEAKRRIADWQADLSMGDARAFQ
jgi:hypothetical protein